MKLFDGLKEFKLVIVGYQFENAQEFYDANWLNVKIEASDENYSWSAVDSCLLTVELKELHAWLKSVDDSCKDATSIDFMEGELRFTYEPSRHIFNVVLNFNFHPKGDAYIYGEDGDSEYVMEFYLAKDDLIILAGQIEPFLKKFPVVGDPY
jgi:hypothetical protein